MMGNRTTEIFERKSMFEKVEHIVNTTVDFFICSSYDMMKWVDENSSADDVPKFNNFSLESNYDEINWRVLGDKYI